MSDRLFGFSWSEILFAPLIAPCTGFLSPHLPYHPPSRERRAAPGRARLGRAPQDTATQPGYSCLCLFARCLLFSVNVFLIINVGLAAAQRGSHGGRACRISLVLRDSAGPGCRAGETGSVMLSLVGCHCRYCPLMGSAHPRRRRLEELGSPWEAPLGLMEDSSSCALPHPTL